MPRLHIGIIDLVTNSAKPSIWGRLMKGNFAAIMPQAIAVWCEEEGHEVTYTCYTGSRDLKNCIKSYDIVMISTFTQSAQMAYAMSNLFRTKGAVTVLGGPHARSYPEDAIKYFDYVLDFTNKELISEVLRDYSPHRPRGIYLSAQSQPSSIPGVRQRWKYIQIALTKAPLIKLIPMIASFGCPYSCNFCTDSTIPYQPLDLEIIKEDLRFLLQKFKRPIVGWCDNNFGVHFNDLMEAIEQAIPSNSIHFYAESSLSILSESNVKRLKRNGFKVILPGIESWNDFGDKSKTGKMTGKDKVQKVSEQVNMILRYIPYIQVNFIFPFDVDKGSEPFELTKRFADMSPGVFPSYALLSAYGKSAPFNLEYQRQNRVLPVPFHILDAQMGFNVRPKNYSWPQFYNYLIDLSKHTFSRKAIFNRFKANKSALWKWMNLFRGITDQGIGRIKLCNTFLEQYHSDRQFRAFHQQETTDLPQYYVDWVRKDLGQLWDWLPEGGLYHDPGAFLKSRAGAVPDFSNNLNK
jgi:hypothetical protein